MLSAIDTRRSRCELLRQNIPSARPLGLRGKGASGTILCAGLDQSLQRIDADREATDALPALTTCRGASARARSAFRPSERESKIARTADETAPPTKASMPLPDPRAPAP